MYPSTYLVQNYLQIKLKACLDISSLVQGFVISAPPSADTELLTSLALGVIWSLLKRIKFYNSINLKDHS
jgi:hypothetical protein